MFQGGRRDLYMDSILAIHKHLSDVLIMELFCWVISISETFQLQFS